LFVLFRDKNNLIKSDETAKDTYSNFISSNDAMCKHHEKLLRIMQAQKTRQINEYQQAEQCKVSKKDVMS